MPGTKISKHVSVTRIVTDRSTFDQPLRLASPHPTSASKGSKLTVDPNTAENVSHPDEPRNQHSEPDDLGSASGSGALRWFRQYGMGVAKAIIWTVVVVGLSLAGRSAAVQWNSETTKIRSEIEVLDGQLSQPMDADRRDAIVGQRDSLRMAIPSFENLSWTGLAIASILYAMGLVPSAMLLHSPWCLSGEVRDSRPPSSLKRWVTWASTFLEKRWCSCCAVAYWHAMECVRSRRP